MQRIKYIYFSHRYEIILLIYCYLLNKATLWIYMLLSVFSISSHWNDWRPPLAFRRQNTSLQAMRLCPSWRHWTGPWPPPQVLRLLSTRAPVTSPGFCHPTAVSRTQHQPVPSPPWTTPTPARDSNSRRVDPSESLVCGVLSYCREMHSM